MTLKEFAKKMKIKDLMAAKVVFEWFKHSKLTFEEFLKEKAKKA